MRIKEKCKSLARRLGFFADRTRSKESVLLDKCYSFPGNRSTMSLRESIAAARSVYSGRLTLFSGDNVKKFEDEFARYHNLGHAISVTSGTAALQVAIAAAGIKEGDEVIVPALTFISTASAVLCNNATPVFVDVNKNDGNIDVAAIEEAISDRTKAIIPVHLCGVPCDMDEIIAIAAKKNMIVIEDAAQAFGSKYRGKMVGSIGDMGCFSFYESKNIVTGEGGMIVTSDEDYYNRIAILSNIGKSGIDGKCERSGKLNEDVHFADLGWNYRMSDTQAAIGNVQLGRIAGLLERRKNNAAYLSQRLSSIEEIEISEIAPYKDPAFNMFIIKVKDSCRWVNAAWLSKALQRKGIPVFLPNARPVNEHPLFFAKGENAPGKIFENARHILGNAIVAQIAPHLNEKDMENIATAIEEVLSYNRRSKAIYTCRENAQTKKATLPKLPERKFCAGSDRVDITPEGTVFLPHLESYSNGTGDPLYARTVVMGNEGADMLCFIHIDLLGMYYDAVLEIRKGISEAINIPVANVFIMFSHTHSTPDLLGIWGRVEEGYFELLYKKTVESAIKAYKNIKPAKIESGTADITDCTRNFTPGAAADPSLAVIRVTGEEGKTISTILNFGVHSPEKGQFACEKKRLISAELPGYICQRSDDIFGGVTLFVNRMVGDSYPELSVGADAEKKLSVGSNFSTSCTAFGDKILSRIQTLEMSPMNDVNNISVRRKEFELPCVDTALSKEYIPRGFSRYFNADRIKTEIANITIGDIEIATFPGELFAEAGLHFLNEMSGANRFIFSLTNDTVGYIIPTDSFCAGGTK